MLPSGDQQLVQILDAALASAAQRSGEWLVCRPGCTQCCVGVFAINQLDAARLREGLRALAQNDAAAAERVLSRARASIQRLAPEYPGEASTGLLSDSEDAQARFEDFANDEPCPALDPATGRCDLYSARPVTCRVFGPPVRSEQGLSVCELCYHGATGEQIAACEMDPDPDGLEDLLLTEFPPAERESRTLVAFALTGAGALHPKS